MPSGSYTDDTSDEFAQSDVFRNVKFSITRDITDDQINYLIEAVEAFPEIEYSLLNFLSRVQDPNALEFVIVKLGERDRETEGHLLWESMVMDQWSPDRMHGRALPSVMKSRLHDLWTNENTIEETRTIAFRLWARNIQPDHIDELKSASDNDLFRYTANYYRLRLGDDSVIKSSSFDLLENDRLLKILPRAWCPEAYKLVDEALGQNSPHEQENLFYNLGDLLFRIPSDEAEELLEKHWDRVGTHPKFFQAALYTATPLTRELAKTTYEESESPAALFGHLRMNFGFKTYGRSELISQAQLFSLEPYLDELDEHDLGVIAEKATEIGLIEWRNEHIQPLLSDDERMWRCPTDEDLHQRLDEIEDGEDITKEVIVWMEDFDRRSESKSRAFKILEEWLDESRSVRGYQMVAEAVKRWGTREELSILDSVSIDDDRLDSYEDAKFGVKARTLS